MAASSQGMATEIARLPLRGAADERLVRLVREGREDAFEEIDRRYRSRLTAYAAGIVQRDRADDVVQEAFVKANDALTRGEAEVHLRPWLYRIVRNTALNELRDAPPPHEELDLEFDGVPQPPDIVARREQIAELTRSIKALPNQQRDAIVQRELEGRSHDEIAASLGVSAGAVRQLIFRARRGLRESIAALTPLPAKAIVAIFAVSGTVATGVAVKDSISHHGHHAAAATVSRSAQPQWPLPQPRVVHEASRRDRPRQQERHPKAPPAPSPVQAAPAVAPSAVVLPQSAPVPDTSQITKPAKTPPHEAKAPATDVQSSGDQSGAPTGRGPAGGGEKGGGSPDHGEKAHGPAKGKK
jgi:RNA polymerase sigma factor (sigma-70 family)